MRRGRFVDGEDLKQLAQLIENIQREISAEYVELPKDADGVPIRVGDVMRDGTVTCIRDAGKGWEIVLDYWGSHQPCDVTHYHEPTVEDVLREFASAYDRIGGEDYGYQKYLNLIAEYAEKLRLAGDGE